MTLNRILSLRTLKMALPLRAEKRVVSFSKLTILDYLDETIFTVEFLRAVWITISL